MLQACEKARLLAKLLTRRKKQGDCQEGKEWKIVLFWRYTSSAFLVACSGQEEIGDWHLAREEEEARNRAEGWESPAKWNAAVVRTAGFSR